MKNFGFKKLKIVSPKFSFPNLKTKTTAVGAFDIINKTKVFNTTDEAVAGFTEIHVKYCVHPAMHCCSSDGVLVASVTQMLTGAAKSVRW